MKVGIIGFGSIGNRHWQNLQPYGADIVVLTKRTDVESVKCVSTWEAFVVAGPFDAIYITNETFKHLETLNKCLDLKPKAVFIEKPLSHNSAGLDGLSKTLREKNISAWVGYNFHFFQPFIRIKEIIQTGALGRIYYLRVSVGQDLADWRQRDYRLSYSANKEAGGGVLLDLVHDINYPAWLLDEQLQPESCIMKKLSDLNLNVEDYVESVLKTESGIMVSVHQDYLRVPYNRSLEIAGSKGSLTWNTEENLINLRDKKGIVISEKIEMERNLMFEKETEFFVKSLQSGEYFSNIDEAIHDVNVIEQLKKYAVSR